MQVFNAYDARNLDDIKARIDRFEEAQKPYVLRILAMRALLDRQADVLEFCLSRGGFESERNLENQSNLVSPESDPKTFQVLEASDFRKKHPRKLLAMFTTDDIW